MAYSRNYANNVWSLRSNSNVSAANVRQPPDARKNTMMAAPMPAQRSNKNCR